MGMSRAGNLHRRKQCHGIEKSHSNSMVSAPELDLLVVKDIRGAEGL